MAFETDNYDLISKLDVYRLGEIAASTQLLSFLLSN